MSSSFRAIRQLERFLFHGVPEQPEPVWERDANEHVGDRLTARSTYCEPVDYDTDEDDQLIATVYYRPELKQVVVVSKLDKDRTSES